MPAPELDPRVRNLCVWIVSCILFGFIIIGCVFLIKGVFLDGGLALATYGLILIAIPWVFWFLTYLYRGIRRLIWGGNKDGGVAGKNGGGNARRGAGPLTDNEPGNAPSKRGDVANDSPVDSPGAAATAAAGRKVQFGDVIVVDDVSGHSQGPGDSQKTSASSTNSYDECERPFAPTLPSS